MRCSLASLLVAGMAVAGCGDDGQSTPRGTDGSTGPGSTTADATSSSSTTAADSTGTTTSSSTAAGSSSSETGVAPTGSTGNVIVELDRVTDGLAALYRFNAGGGTVIQDVSGVGDPLNLSLTSASSVVWNANSLTVTATVRMTQAVTPEKIVDACTGSEELSAEVWVASEVDTLANAVIMTLSTAEDGRAFTLGQNGAAWDFRLNTDIDSLDGLPTIEVPGDVTSMSHVVVTRNAAGDVEFFVDGVSAATETRAGDFSMWPAASIFTLSAEVTNGFPFRGEFGLAAVYCRALTPTEVLQNFEAGF